MHHDVCIQVRTSDPSPSGQLNSVFACQRCWPQCRLCLPRRMTQLVGRCCLMQTKNFSTVTTCQTFKLKKCNKPRKVGKRVSLWWPATEWQNDIISRCGYATLDSNCLQKKTTTPQDVQQGKGIWEVGPHNETHVWYMQMEKAEKVSHALSITRAVLDVTRIIYN